MCLITRDEKEKVTFNRTGIHSKIPKFKRLKREK